MTKMLLSISMNVRNAEIWNMLWMNENGITIYLEMTPKAIYSRIKDQRETRPLLQKIPEDKLLPILELPDKLFNLMSIG